ncbi:MAG TPA: hypothetical protein VFC44_27110 [Candidatus Saccharimonadales bacterium]|nr:hypothetical protein [Candidatus Saccharimonadales bacterium]
MGPFWKHFSVDVGGYGRNGGTVFFLTVGLGLGLLIGIAVIYEISEKYFPLTIGAAAFIIVSCLGRAICRARRDRSGYSIQPLSREEMRRARSKLLGNQQSRKL